jgi:hypothetical protein
MTALEDIQKEILERSDREIEDEYKMSLFGELMIILTRLIFIIIVSFAFYYGLAYLIVYDSYSWESYRETVLQFSFWMGIISVFLISIRGQVGSLLFQASAIRISNFSKLGIWYQMGYCIFLWFCFCIPLHLLFH